MVFLLEPGLINTFGALMYEFRIPTRQRERTLPLETPTRRRSVKAFGQHVKAIQWSIIPPQHFYSSLASARGCGTCLSTFIILPADQLVIKVS